MVDNINKDNEINEIIDSFDKFSKTLEKQITNVELRQQELQNYMVTLDNHINHFDQMVNMELQQQQPNYKKITGLRKASFDNIELLTNVHNAYKEYENVKFKYFKEIGSNNTIKQKLIHVDIKRVGTTEEMGTEFYEIMRNLSRLNVKSDNTVQLTDKQIQNNNKLLEQVQSGFVDDEYKL